MPPHRPPDPAESAALTELLGTFAENLTARVTSGSHGDTFRREAEINQVLQALASPLRGRVAIIGLARAGKTAVVHGATARIASGDCPPDVTARQNNLGAHAHQSAGAVSARQLARRARSALQPVGPTPQNHPVH